MDGPIAKDRAGGVLLITLTLLSWSSVPLFVEYFTAYIDGWTANGWRYGIAALFWAPVILVGLRRHMLPARLWRAAVVPSLINAAAQTCYAWSPYFIDPAMMSFMMRFQIIFVAFGAFVLFPSERRVVRAPSYWIGVIVVLAGAIGTCLLGKELPRGATAFGIGLAISAGIIFGGYSLAVRYFMEGIHPVTAFAAISHYTAAALVLIMLSLGRRHGLAVAGFSAGQWGTLAGSALIGIALAHVFYYASIVRLGVAVSAGVILLQPFITGIASYVLFRERLTPAQWISGLVAICGAIIMLRCRHLACRPGEPVAARCSQRAAFKGRSDSSVGRVAPRHEGAIPGSPQACRSGRTAS